MAMDNGVEKTTAGEPVAGEEPQQPLSLAFSKRGVHTGKDFAGLMSALMSDLIEGRITPGVGNAVCNAGGKMLKVVELQMRYGQAGPGTGERVLTLTDGR